MTLSVNNISRRIGGNGIPAAERANTAGVVDIRALLADTALLVSSLRAGGNVGSVKELRERSMKFISTLADELERCSVPADVRQDALLAQCALLDESVLFHLGSDLRSGWDVKPLQVECFNRHDAGSQVFERLEARMQETPPNVGLLEAYAAILGLGFNGRYSRDPEGRRQVVDALEAMLVRLGRGSHRAFVADHSRARMGDWFRRLSPWGIFALSCGVASIVFAVWNGTLAAQLSSLLQTKS